MFFFIAIEAVQDFIGGGPLAVRCPFVGTRRFISTAVGCVLIGQQKDMYPPVN
jgi:hypothetical protein